MGVRHRELLLRRRLPLTSIPADGADALHDGDSAAEPSQLEFIVAPFDGLCRRVQAAAVHSSRSS